MVDPPDNRALALFTKALVALHPELEQGLPEGLNLNTTCMQVFENWAGSLTAYHPDDVLAVSSTRYAGYSSSNEDSVNQICVQLACEQTQSVYLKDFVNSSVPFALAMETIRVINRVSYGNLEIWAPELIRELYGYTAWGGSDTDDEFLEHFEEMNDEPFDPEQHQALLPSSWTDTMLEAGYLEVGFKPTMGVRKLNTFKCDVSRVNDLVDALKAIHALNELPVIHSSDETQNERVMAAFVFLWNDDAFLVDAIDEVVNYRYEGGESSEVQSLLDYTSATKDSTLKEDLKCLERQLQYRVAIARQVDAIRPFCAENETEEGTA